MGDEPSTLKKRDLFEQDEPPAAERVPGMVLVFSGGQPLLSVLSAAAGEVIIGRGDTVLMLQQDMRMSRRHARIRYDGERFWAEDLGTQNGTSVDGRTLVPGTVTEASKIVHAGGSLFLLSQDIRPFQSWGVQLDGDRVMGPAQQAVFQRVLRAAQFSPVLHITGESGVGKEGVARAFHERAAQGAGRFLAVNCAAIPQGVAERLLFGTRRGAFSGADAEAEGYVQAAHGGTLFLDEVAELEQPVQAKLLRVLETREVLPLGASRPVPVEFSLCSASHRKLREQVAAGALREDLYYRIGQPEVALPPLRQRLEEVPWLVTMEVRRCSAQLTVLPSLVEACLLRPWPGNIRELLTAVRLAAHEARAAGERQVSARHLNAAAGLSIVAPQDPLPDSKGEPPVSPEDLARRIEMQEMLRKEKGNVSRAARSMGVHRTQFCRWMIRYRLIARDFS